MNGGNEEASAGNSSFNGSERSALTSYGSAGVAGERTAVSGLTSVSEDKNGFADRILGRLIAVAWH